MTEHLTQRFPAWHSPKADSILTCRHQAGSIARERHRVDPASVTVQRPEMCTASRIPEDQGVLAGGCQYRPVRRKGETLDDVPLILVLEQLDDCSRREIVQADGVGIGGFTNQV